MMLLSDAPCSASEMVDGDGSQITFHVWGKRGKEWKRTKENGERKSSWSKEGNFRGVANN